MVVIPEHLEQLLRELAAEHWLAQLVQMRRLGFDHPQGRAAQQHLEAARELAHLAGIKTNGG